ncbi:MAG TPA: glucose-1-phosphate thymidylyltransferase [Candidatus Aenigmarchaeota archaeon]|nr:glucose-1-phosphate thymidylyltransferase [Candidatus Aenigmarchaeota archaeon]
MQAVILAAGKSTRTYPLTLTRPKVLLEVMNKPIIQHNLEGLTGLVDEVIVIVGYKKEMVIERFGNEFRGMRLKYVEQDEQLGTAHAVLKAEGFVKDRFLVLMGDDIYERSLFEECVKHDMCVTARRVKDPERFGVWITEGKRVKGFAEKPKEFVSDLANCGCYVLDREIFPEIRRLERSERGEYELNEAVNALAEKREVNVIDAGNRWVAVTYPWNLLDANEVLLGRVRESRIDGEVEEYAKIKGPAVIGEGTLVKSGAYIEGPVVIGKNCKIGPNCFIRPFTSIGNNCRIGNCVEIKNSIIMDGSKIGHLSYIGDSVIGYNVNIGGGTLTANLRHDGENIKSLVKEEMINTYRRKLGVIIGDNAKTGINTSFYPGRKVWPGRTTLPGEIVRSDVM